MITKTASMISSCPSGATPESGSWHQQQSTGAQQWQIHSSHAPQQQPQQQGPSGVSGPGSHVAYEMQQQQQGPPGNFGPGNHAPSDVQQQQGAAGFAVHPEPRMQTSTSGHQQQWQQHHFQGGAMGPANAGCGARPPVGPHSTPAFGQTGRGALPPGPASWPGGIAYPGGMEQVATCLSR